MMNVVRDLETGKGYFLMLLESYGADEFVRLNYEQIHRQTGIDTFCIKMVTDALVKEGKIQRNEWYENGKKKFSYKLNRNHVLANIEIKNESTETAPVMNEVTMEDKQTLQIIDERTVLGKRFRIYGTKENPLFLAKDVAEWIEHTHTTNMLKSIDEDEKLNVTILHAGQKREVIMLTEDGLYEVLMQSRKPIAKAFKKEVKAILKHIRLTGGHVATNKEEEFIDYHFASFSEETKKQMVTDLIKANDNYKKQLNGWGERATMAIGMEILGIDGATSGDLSRALENLGYGSYDVVHGYKNKFFEPNEKFLREFCATGYVTSNVINNGNRTKLDFKRGFFELIKERKEIMEECLRLSMVRRGIA